MNGKRGWFADIDHEITNPSTGEPMWQACLETGVGIIPTISIWFDTERQCNDWIQEFVIGQSWLDSDTPA